MSAMPKTWRDYQDSLHRRRTYSREIIRWTVVCAALFAIVGAVAAWVR